MSSKSLSAAVVFVAWLASMAPAQITVALTPYADGTLYFDAAGSLANGSGSLLFSGLNANSAARRGILVFDLTQVPPGSFVCSASLRMTAVNTTNNGTASIAVHRVTNTWGEGASVAPGAQGGGGPAQAGDTTWLHTFFPSSFWSAAGGDMIAVASGATDISSPGTYTWPSSGSLVGDVQFWVDNPASNYGWILRSPESAPQSMKHFGSRENSTAANRPQLVVTFYPAVAAAVTVTGSACSLPPESLLTLSASGLPTIPNPTFGLQVAGGPPGGTASVFLSPTLASPAALSSNCFVLLDLIGVLDLINAGISPLGPLSLDFSGAAFLTIPVPAAPCIGGAQAALQALCFDPQFSAGFAVSNALALVAGH